MTKKHLLELFTELFWIFLLGCFLGVVIESIWCIVTRGYYESRSGLIYGPFNLVYGFGVLLMTIGLLPLKGHKDQSIFFGGFCIGTIFEYICSFVQEQWFGTVSWDYSRFPLNLNGRVNLLYSCFWGLLALFWIKQVYPFLIIQIRKVPFKLRTILTIIFLIFIIFDGTISALALARQDARRENIEATTQLEIFLDTHYPDERLNEIYPNMKVIDK